MPMANNSDKALILKALEFAAERHRTQFRKGLDRTPFINHPVQVASLLANDAGETDTDLLAAAILHDVIEDTVSSVAEKNELVQTMHEIFGTSITSIALEVTDDKTIEKKDRKRLQVENAPFVSLRAKKLRIADKIMNIRDITANPPEDWTLQRIADYFDWAEKVVAGLRGVNLKLEMMFDESLARGRMKYGFMRSEDSELP